MPQSAILFSFVFALLLTLAFTPLVLHFSKKHHLYDHLDARKIHKGKVSRLGGVIFTPCMFLSFAIVCAVSPRSLGFYWLDNFNSRQILLLSLAILIVYVEGLADDVFDLRYRTKFIVQFVCAVLLISAGLWVKSLHGLFGVYEWPVWVGVPISVLLIMLIINAMNLIDGIDGLSSGLCIIGLSFLGFLFYANNDVPASALSFAVVGALITFFCFNVFGNEKRGFKIFMGDCGSQTLGLLMALLVLYYCLSGVSPHALLKFSNPLVPAFSILLIPCFDVARVMTGRMRRGSNPFEPDKTHIHHKFLALGFSQHKSLASLLLLDVLFIVFNVAAVNFANINVILLIDVVAWVALQKILSDSIRSKKNKAGNQAL